MSIDYSGSPISKGEPRKRTKAREKREQGDVDALVRVFAFGRERGICRCCKIRAAESRHELIARGAGGKVSRKNSIAVCGVIVGAVPSCHTFLQNHSIQWMADEGLGAQGPLVFTPINREAADWMHVAIGQSVHSEPMSVYEASE